jgi:hypothetical protein
MLSRISLRIVAVSTAGSMGATVDCAAAAPALTTRATRAPNNPNDLEVITSASPESGALRRDPRRARLNDGNM